MTYHKIDPFGVVSKVANVKGAYIDCQFDIQIRKGTNELMYLKLGTFCLFLAARFCLNFFL